MNRFLSIIIAAALLAACSDGTPPPASTKTVVVKASEYGDRWPLTANEATIGCESPTKAFLDIAGRRCGLNGKALSAGMERCDDASKTGNAVAFGVFIEKALVLCPTRN